MAATLLPLGVVWALGALFGIFYSDSTFFAWSAALLLLLSSLLFFFFFRKQHFLFQTLLYLSFGFGWCAFVSTHTTRPLTITGTVPVYADCEILEAPQHINHSYGFPVRLYLNQTQYTLQAYANYIPYGLISGDHIRVIGTLKSFTRGLTKHANSVVLSSAVSGTQGVLTVRSITETKRTATTWKHYASQFSDRINRWIQETIYSRMSGEGAVLCESLLLGNYQQLGDDTIADFRRTGLVHLLALSGLQMMMIWGMIEGLGSILHLPFKPRLVFILLGLLFYRFLLPPIASVDRAMIMALWFIGARFNGVKLSGWQAWSGALFTQSLLTPEQVVTPGFQLSFSAVAGLLFVNPIQKKLFSNQLERPQLDLLKWLTFGLLTSIAAIVASAPFLIYHFGYVSYSGLLMNIPAIPLSGLILFGTVLLCLFSWTGYIAQWIAIGTERCSDLLIWLARFPGSTWGPGGSAYWWALLFAGGFFLCLLSINKGWKWKRIIAVSLLGFSIGGYLFTKDILNEQQKALTAMVYKDNDRNVYIADDSHKASEFARGWMHEFGDKKLTIMVLRSESVVSIPTNDAITITNAYNIECGMTKALTDRIVWQSVRTEEGDDVNTGWGVLTDSSDMHHAYFKHLPTRELAQLGWSWQLPTGKRAPIGQNELPDDALWFVTRWNRPD